jgi:uncharacterized protein (DUF58 family)
MAGTTRAVRLTSAGLVLGVASVAMLVLAYAFGYPAFASIGLAGIIVLASVVPLAARHSPVEIGREIYPVRVTRGEIAVGLLTVRNGSTAWGQRLSALERLGGRDIPVRIGRLPPRGAVEIRYPLPTGRRGVIEVGPLRWDRTDPLGLIGRRSALPGTATLHVHPAVHRFPLGAAARNVHGDQVRTDLAPEGSVTFHTLREYVPGDDLRRIHWRASAHRDVLMVRQFIDVTPPRSTVLLITDAELYASPDDFEEAVDVAASATIGAIRSGEAVALWTTGGLRLTGNGGPEDAMTFLDRLATVGWDPTPRDKRAGTGLRGTLDRLEHADRGGTLVIAGGRPEMGELGALSTIARHFGLAVLARIGPAQERGPGSGLTVIDAPTAAEVCERWARLAPTLSRGGAR